MRAIPANIVDATWFISTLFFRCFESLLSLLIDFFSHHPIAIFPTHCLPWNLGPRTDPYICKSLPAAVSLDIIDGKGFALAIEASDPAAVNYVTA